MFADLKVKDSDGKQYQVTIVAKSSSKLPSLDSVPQTDEGEKGF